MFQSIQRQTGLPLFFDPLTSAIKWVGGIKVEKTSSRNFAEMKDYTAEALAQPTSDPIYLMYRSVARSEEYNIIRAARLRYDITVIPPGYFIGREKEFFRTAGHYHPVKPGTTAIYPEIYEVVSGRANLLIQKPKGGDPKAIDEIFTIEVGPGEKAVIPPGFGHMSVNAFDEPLVMANWISADFTYDYSPYKSMRGSAYWMIEGSTPEAIEFRKNGNYALVPELQKLRPRELEDLGISHGEPLYSLVSELDKLAFLNAPEDFINILTIDRCYQYVLN